MRVSWATEHRAFSPERRSPCSQRSSWEGIGLGHQPEDFGINYLPPFSGCSLPAVGMQSMQQEQWYLCSLRNAALQGPWGIGQRPAPPRLPLGGQGSSLGAFVSFCFSCIIYFPIVLPGADPTSYTQSPWASASWKLFDRKKTWIKKKRCSWRWEANGCSGPRRVRVEPHGEAHLCGLDTWVGRPWTMDRRAPVGEWGGAKKMNDSKDQYSCNLTTLFGWSNDGFQSAMFLQFQGQGQSQPPFQRKL